ncbi:aromatic compound dioxygenase [Penicillium angulare]|uniref:aromatic compound dioxygenase n=1 Tax=Penicillium angulare TaxID=116970 RepID=UPI00254186C1|nr:aromatic compound dioxygenase [Penicillium angulare]KAJ5261177.1 aromatic compound dioxygenase [Penicillium angulare]
MLPRSVVQRQNQLSRRCAGHVANFNKRRINRRWEALGRNVTFEVTSEAPFYETIQNDTCVLMPEVTSGPYLWPRSQILRQDMTEDQLGVPLWLDIGVLDMATCEPLPNALVDLWHCNATGSYSSFTELSPNTPFPELLAQLNVTDLEMGVTDLHTDDSTWLRGMWPTDANGIMEMKTVFPGYYVERAIHIHIQVHTEWSIRNNGTIIASNTSNTSNTISTGQLYFEEELEQKIMTLPPYASHTQINRTTNAADSFFSGGMKGGYNPMISVVPADGQDVRNGVIGYITVGVDTSAIENVGN